MLFEWLQSMGTGKFLYLCYTNVVYLFSVLLHNLKFPRLLPLFVWWDATFAPLSCTILLPCIMAKIFKNSGRFLQCFKIGLLTDGVLSLCTALSVFVNLQAAIIAISVWVSCDIMICFGTKLAIWVILISLLVDTHHWWNQ